MKHIHLGFQTMNKLSEHEVFTLIGETGFERICHEFYVRVRADEILSPMYPDDDWEGAEQRLRTFLIYRFGGPPTYIQQRGHPRLRMRHAPFAIDQAARDRWMELMNDSLASVDLEPAAERTLQVFFEHMTTFLINRP